MRNHFAHLLPLTDAETEAIWNEGTLTVDANVLLDLYRYHSETRDALIQALRGFQERLWLSHQAALEFVRNRTRASSVVAKDLGDAEKALRELEAAMTKAADDLRGRRPLSRGVSEKLRAEINAAIGSARKGIEDTQTRHADGAATDAVLDKVLSLFNGRVGSPPRADELAELSKEAERRIREKVPPGYGDAKKGGESSHGDYLVWHQVLQHAQSSATPMIFVTSERKEDWWERAHGRTLGPRHELLEEAHRVAGKRVLIFQTDSFVEQATRRAGGTVSRTMLNDIRATRGDQELEDAVRVAVDDLGDRLVDLVDDLSAETNASEWTVDQVEVADAGPLDYSTCTAPFTASVHYSGSQNEDQMWCGDHIKAELRGTIAFEDDSWVVREYRRVNAEIERDDLAGEQEGDGGIADVGARHGPDSGRRIPRN